MRPLVLLSNDDGYLSPHIHELADAIDDAGIADTLVIAPERERSAASHTITLHKPLRLHERAPGRFVLSGTPVDCVYVGVLELAAARPPALVVSGVNRGYNIGSDVFYSGTVAAAVEGGLRGHQSIALSTDSGAECDVPGTIAFALPLIRALIADPLPDKTVLNVNVPAGAGGRYQWTRLGERSYADDVAERVDPRGRSYYWIGGGAIEGALVPGTDGAAIAAGMIALTPLYLDLTAEHLLSDTSGAVDRWDIPGYRPVAIADMPPFRSQS